jgi:hypothetical protein
MKVSRISVRFSEENFEGLIPAIAKAIGGTWSSIAIGEEGVRLAAKVVLGLVPELEGWTAMYKYWAALEPRARMKGRMYYRTCVDSGYIKEVTFQATCGRRVSFVMTRLPTADSYHGRWIQFQFANELANEWKNWHIEGSWRSAMSVLESLDPTTEVVVRIQYAEENEVTTVARLLAQMKADQDVEPF